MRFLLAFFIITNSIICVAQDPEFSDFRTKRESFAKIYDKDIKSDLASFTIGGIEESLNATKLKKLPITKFGADYITYDSNNLQVTIKAGVFFSTKHKMGIEGNHVNKIDNKAYYGNYGRIPAATIASVTVVMDKDTIAIPSNAYADLYNPHFIYKDGSNINRSQDAVYLSADKRKIYIYMLNRDDSGSYEVTWVIQDKKYLRRVIDYGFTK